MKSRCPNLWPTSFPYHSRLAHPQTSIFEKREFACGPQAKCLMISYQCMASDLRIISTDLIPATVTSKSPAPSPIFCAFNEGELLGTRIEAEAKKTTTFFSPLSSPHAKVSAQCLAKRGTLIAQNLCATVTSNKHRNS